MSDRGRLKWIWTRIPISAIVFAAAMAATVPSLGDLGLTWDEPAYRYSQIVSAQWWEGLARSRSVEELGSLLTADALLYYWPYARHGINFHPPLAGQLNLLTFELFGGWMKDIPARRLASAVEFALAIALLHQFVGRRHGFWAGLTAAGALLTMPRVFGDAHLAGTDIPGLLIWPATAVAAWKALNEPESRWCRVAFGVLLGLGFLTKMGAVVVVVPVFMWMLLSRGPALLRKGGWRDWLSGFVMLWPILTLLVVAFLEVRRLAALLPEPQFTDLFLQRPPSRLPGAVLLLPLGWWIVRLALGRLTRRRGAGSIDRPALDLLTAALAIPPAVAWLGNPAWWRETFTRLAHYYLLNTNRSGSLPDIRIHYWGETYLYSLPWHNAWVLMAITVPVGWLILAVSGVGRGFWIVRSDRLPLYLLAHLVTLPVFRMLPTPAHDGVRLFLPTFWFLAAFAGLGATWIGNVAARMAKDTGHAAWFRAGVGGLAIALSVRELVKVHPYELSYYNQLVGGPAGAWRRGFELSYWYDAFDAPTLREIERMALPEGASLTAPNQDENVPTFAELQSLGELRPDIRLSPEPDAPFGYKWLLTHDSKANAYSRLLFAMTPSYSFAPAQLGRARVVTVSSPAAAARAWALQLMTDVPENRRPLPERSSAPVWVDRFAPALRRFWGVGLTRPRPPAVNELVFEWARSDPGGFLAAAEEVARAGSLESIATDSDAGRLLGLIEANFGRSSLVYLLDRNREAMVEAARALVARPAALRTVLLAPGYTDPRTIGGMVDQRGASLME